MANEKSRNRLSLCLPKHKECVIYFPVCFHFIWNYLPLFLVLTPIITPSAMYWQYTFKCEMNETLLFLSKKKRNKMRNFQEGDFLGGGKGGGESFAAPPLLTPLSVSRSILPAGRFSRFPLLVRWASHSSSFSRRVCFHLHLCVWPIQTHSCVYYYFFCRVP